MKCSLGNKGKMTMTNDWINTLAEIMGVLPHGILKLEFMGMLAATAFVLFVVVCAHGVATDPEEDGQDQRSAD